MDVFQLSIYFTASGICLFFSVAIIVAQAVLKVNAIFSRIGLYLFFTNLVALAYALLYVPGLEAYSRELLILQRMASLVSGYPLISMINVIKKDFLKRHVIAIIFAMLSVMLVVALIDLVGDFGWLFLDPPPRVNQTLFYKFVYIPFGFYALGSSIVIFIMASRKVTGDTKRLVCTLVAGIIINLLCGAWAYVISAFRSDPFHDAPFFFNPAILILAFFIFLFIIQFINLHMKYAKSAGLNKARPGTVEDEALDRELFGRISVITAERRLYADTAVTVEKMAAAIGQSRNGVSRVINKYSKGNFNAFINAYRVEEMKKSLADPVLTSAILEIGEKAGFSSKASMNRIFKQLTGLSPKEYRDETRRGAAWRRPDNSSD